MLFYLLNDIKPTCDNYIMSGTVYCITNDNIHYKVGKTGRTAEARAREIEGQTICEPFRVVFSIMVNNMKSAEQEAHQLLKQYRVRKNKEFFKVSPTVIGDVFDILEDMYPFKELVDLQEEWFRCHQYIMRLERSLDSPAFILYKRKKAELECLIDLMKYKKVTPESKICSNFWNEQPVNQDPVDLEILESLEFLEI